MPFPTRWRIPGLVALYAILAGLWIYLSDGLVAFLAADPADLTRLQTFKGWGFVAFTAALLGLILRHEARAREARDRALRDSEETYRTLFEVESDALFLIDNATGRLLAANPAAAELYGYTPQELLGLRNTDLSAEPGETQRVTTGTPIAPDAIVRIPHRSHRKRDGTIFPVEITGRFFTWHGRPVHLAAIRDITERRQAEVTFARYRLLAEQARDIVLFVRRDGQILEANQAAVQAYGHSLEELGTLHIQDLRAPETQPLTTAQLAQADAGGILFETVHRRKDGTTFPVEVSSRGADLGGERVLLSIIRDIRERKRAEQALATRSRQLEAVQVITAEITRELDIEALLWLIHRRAIELIGVTGGSLYLWDEAQQLLVPQIWHGIPDSLGTLPVRPGEGLVGTVVARGTGLIVNDYRSSPHAHPVFLAETAIVAALAEPLLYHERLVGVIVLNSHQPGRSFTEEERALLAFFAAHAAIAIQHARLFRAEHDRRAQLEALRATTADITGELDLTTVLHLVARRACELTGAAAADIDLWDSQRQLLVPETSYGHAAPRPKTTRRLGEGTMGTVAQTHQGLMLNDYRRSPLAHPDTLAHTRITASLVEPLLYRDTLLGVIGVDHETPGHAFTDHDQATLRLFAAHAAIAIQNARLFRAEHHRRAELEALRATTADITRELDLNNLLRLLIARATELVGASSATVYLWEAAQELVVPAAWHGLGDWQATIRHRLGQGIAGTVVQTRRGVLVNDYRTSRYANPVSLQHTAVTASMGEPLLYREELIGAITLNHEGGRCFTAEDQALLRLFADQAAIAIQNARLYTAAQQALADLRQAQDELVRTEKLRGLGQMAAGIAHDLNNTLATILGQAELLRLRTHHPEVQEGLQTLETAASDGAQVVRRLQDFARQRGGGPLRACDLGLLVPEVLEITRPRWREEPRRKGIVIEASVDLPGLPLIQGNPAEIREVLANLIFNAVDAMPNGGSLRFSGRLCDGGDPQRPEWMSGVPRFPGQERVEASPPLVELEVTDTGIGMTDEVRRRVFDPFFTTKGLHGTGLGLSVVYGIMGRHGGQINVTSAPGQGTTIRLRFRLASPDTGAVARPPTPGKLPVRRILLVDDDADVRETMATLLRASGQEVLEADSGEAALKRLETTPVDLVLTDLGMPEITGWDVARAAKAGHPDLPVVLLTGWGDQAGAEAPPGARVDRVLAKPVPRSTVLAVIAELTGPRQ
ncbi:MAG TPA: GAF domain-containing protein [Candidatus Methylomirabilis sp.]|nr:GAF domain-containing protein [Candidatus Methylomirabilis sp.]